MGCGEVAVCWGRGRRQMERMRHVVVGERAKKSQIHKRERGGGEESKEMCERILQRPSPHRVCDANAHSHLFKSHLGVLEGLLVLDTGHVHGGGDREIEGVERRLVLHNARVPASKPTKQQEVGTWCGERALSRGKAWVQIQDTDH